MNRSDPDRFDSRKWILGFFAIVLAAVLVLSVAAYAIDPFLQFRVKDNAYLLRGWFVDSGLIENYDYNYIRYKSRSVTSYKGDEYFSRLLRLNLYVRDLMRRFSLRPEELLVVDDLKPGYDMARAAGVDFAAVGWANDIPQIEAFMRRNCALYFKTPEAFAAFLR